MAAKVLFSALLGSVILVSCSKHGGEAPPFLFAGECTAEVVSETAGAEIQIDGVTVGKDRMKVELPCGEKKIGVLKPGYLPYEHYLITTRDEPLKVTVKLERTPSQQVFALSDELARQVAMGVKPVDPSSPEGKALLAKAEIDARDRFAQQVAAAKAGAAGGAAAAGSGAAAGGPLGPGPWDQVDYWR
jgi:hypothetical protein